MGKILYQKQLPGYGNVVIEDTTMGKKAVRLFKVDGAVESVMYLDEEQAGEMFSDYLNAFNWIFSLKPDLQKTLLIGGGGFIYPKHYLMHHPDKEIHTVEISHEMVELASRFFGLNHLMKEHEEHFRLIEADGQEYLKNSDEVYDVILNDAYIGSVFHKGLQSNEAMAEIKRHLKADGIYAINLVTAPKGIHAIRGNRLIRRLQKHFKYTFFMTASDDLSDYERQNCLVFASDKEFGM